MGIERLKSVKNQIMCAVEGQIHNLSETDTKEMGEAIDMLKDLSEAIYYCTVTESMEEASEEDKKHYMDKYLPETAMYYTPMYARQRDSRGRYMYTEPMWHDDYVDDNYRSRMYYSSMNGNSSNNNSMNYARDYREGRSPMIRRTYMEMKEQGKDTSKELEHFMEEMASDITEMVEKMNPTEKTMLKQKLATLASKIA